MRSFFISIVLLLGACSGPETRVTSTGTRTSLRAASCDAEPNDTQCLPPATREERARRAIRGPQSVLGEPLAICSLDPLTGYFRSGRCETGPSDRGVHVVCSEVDAEFLAYTKARGNDLSTPRGSFPGLTAGDRWCLCASRWEEARRAGVAPPVVLEATDEAALRVVDRETLERYASTETDS